MQEPSFTVGIEEEYLLVDAGTRDLIHEAPPTMLSQCEALLEGQVAPEFLQCQIEVGTRVCSTIGEAPLRSGAAAQHRRVGGPLPRTAARRGVDAPVRGVGRADAHPESALPDDRARSAGGGAPPRHLRDARARRHRRRRAARRSHEPGELRAPAPACAGHLVAVLAGPRHGAQILPDLGVGRDAAHRDSGAVRKPRRVSAPSRRARPRRDDRRRDKNLVGRAPERAVSDPGNAHQRHLHAARGHRMHRRAVRVLAAHALPAARQEPALAALPAHAHRREPVACPAVRHRPGARGLRPRRGRRLSRAPRGDDRALRGRRRGARLHHGGRACPPDRRPRHKRALAGPHLARRHCRRCERARSARSGRRHARRGDDARDSTERRTTP